MVFEIIKKTFLWGMLCASIAIAVYAFAFRIQPCVAPIQYHIGTFDSRFGISQKDFLVAIAEAEVVWDKPFQKTFFEYNPDDTHSLAINLVYDNRQKTTEKNALLKADVNKTNQLASGIKAEYVALETQYTRDSGTYTQALRVFETHQQTYSASVSYWNSRGGAPSGEYEKLNAEKNSLAQEHAILENKRVALNTLVDEINTFISKYNLLVQNANTTIGTINQTAGSEFQEGVYDPNTQAVTIYEFSDHQKLVRVLAHELGHALGLDHNDNPKSIMYSLNMSSTMTPSKEDISALKAVCAGPGISPVVPWMVRAKIFLDSLFAKVK